MQWAEPATFTGGVFLVPSSAFTDVHALLIIMLPSTSTTCAGGVFRYQPAI